MTVNQILIDALSPLGIPVTPDFNGGGAKEYITFNCVDDSGAVFGDDAPILDVALMQIHYFLPLNKDYLGTRKKIRRRLFEAGFTFPEVEELTEETKRHIIFECEIENNYEMEE